MPDKPLAVRLQVKPGRALAVVNAPAGADAIIGAADQRTLLDQADVVLAFMPDRADLDARLPGLLATIHKDAILWLAYPKLSSPLAAGLSRDIIHALAPSHGLTTVAAVAVDADWSAMRLKRIG